MKIVFRADASVEIGSGHVMRCLTFADQLRTEGAEVVFVCRDFPGGLFELLQTQGYRVATLPYAEGCKVSQQVDAEETIKTLAQIGMGELDWLVVDHYALNATWEQILRPHAHRIMVIDDLADRQHDCDLLLDQNFYEGLENRYTGLVPEHCIKLLGPHFALLRSEFRSAHRFLDHFDGRVRRMLIFFGGSDLSNETGKTLAAIDSLGRPSFSVDVVVGTTNPNKEEIRTWCGSLSQVSYHCQIDNMAELMARSDLIIGAGGTTTWERCSLGIPSITLVLADNQYETTQAVAAAGATYYLGRSTEVTSDDIAVAIKYMLANPSVLLEMSRKALGIMGDDLSSGRSVLLEAIMVRNYAQS